MRLSYKKLAILTGWAVFVITFLVYFFSAERSGSLWDCGEFILGAYKLQVVHPPGAPMFLLMARIFAMVADWISNNPSDIAFAVNLFSGASSAAAAMLVSWTTMIFSQLTLKNKVELEQGFTRDWLSLGAGVVAGLATAFSTSIWFSAVEGEVYSLSTFFTCLTLWATIKWYSLPDHHESDRWLIFAVYSAGLSIGVHLLSLLLFPAMALFYYFKKRKKSTWRGMIVAAGIGAVLIGIIQIFIITGIPKLWAGLELLFVNGFGMPFQSGLVPLLLILGGIVFFGLRYAHKKKNQLVQILTVGFALVVISYSVIGVVVIRANADPPINMNDPSDPLRLIPYLNREQYGERPILKGPHFDAQVVATDTKDKYGRVDDRYEIVDYRVIPKYRDSDKMLFPRMGHTDENRKALYRIWMDNKSGVPTMADNIIFFFRYQIGWMYWRYFMWNFSGRLNGDQGFFPWDLKRGHWYSGVPFFDNIRLFNQSELPTTMREEKSRNRYFLLPFLFGLLGLLFHFRNKRDDAIGLLVLFLITGIGIIIYSNQPPNEPRERDYVLAGSIFTFCIWIGLGIPALYQLLKNRVNISSKLAVPISIGAVLVAPVIMGFQNFDDHSRHHLSGARDYASNFLESCEPNSIIFTYGDNDTYPLWYAQEVEGIRTDVRVINLSLIAVDWYVNQMRRRINDSPPVKFSISAEGYRGSNRNALYYPGNQPSREMSLEAALKFMGERHPLPTSSGREFESYLPSTNLYLTVDKQRTLDSGLVPIEDSAKIVSRIPILISGNSITKDDLAVLDIISSNFYDRPIYYSVTSREDRLYGMGDYMQLEGLALRLIPVKTESQKIFGIHGNGRVNKEAVYDNILNKFKWGGFDEFDLFVTSSFVPSYYAHKTMFERTAYQFLNDGETDKAVELVDKYFVAFPHINFPYDARILNLLRVYEQAGQYEKAKSHMEILAKETEEYLGFYQSLSPDELRMGFAQDQNTARTVVAELKRMANAQGDNEFYNQLQVMFDKYQVSNVPG